MVCQVNVAFYSHPLCQFVSAGIPLEAAFQVASDNVAKGVQGKSFTFYVGLFRKTQTKIGLHDMAAFAGDAIKDGTQTFSHSGNKAIR